MKEKKKKDEINKKYNWNIYRKPLFTMTQPQPPLKELEFRKEELIINKDCTDGDEFKLSEIIPDGYDSKDLFVRVESTVDYYDSYETVYLQVIKITNTAVKNAKYDKQNEKYEKDLKNWENKKNEYEEELKLWEKWVKQEKEKELQEKLSAAEKLLKKHGKLK